MTASWSPLGDLTGARWWTESTQCRTSAHVAPSFLLQQTLDDYLQTAFLPYIFWINPQQMWVVARLHCRDINVRRSLCLNQIANLELHVAYRAFTLGKKLAASRRHFCPVLF